MELRKYSDSHIVQRKEKLGAPLLGQGLSPNTATLGKRLQHIPGDRVQLMETKGLGFSCHQLLVSCLSLRVSLGQSIPVISHICSRAWPAYAPHSEAKLTCAGNSSCGAIFYLFLTHASSLVGTPRPRHGLF